QHSLIGKRQATSAIAFRRFAAMSILPRLYCLLVIFTLVVPSRAEEPVQAPVFVSGKEGYHTFRIPSLIVTKKGTLLAFCEGRKTSASDTGAIDLLLRRSLDGGKTWQKTQVVWEDRGNTCGNPCPLVDRDSGTIWLLMTH